MQNEKIGAVTLDYRFYTGEDKYSDGSIEDEMLELAKAHGGEDYNRIIAEKSSWPILYHFSHVRKNIVEWLPMTGQEHVLEIGAGPGAITGVLAEKAKDVTCVDLSRKRCLINAYRNQEYGNIRILVGNFQDIAEGLEEKFDLITLIGVFEYAQFSIQSPQPFHDYLQAIRRLLAPGGRLVIAIENRLGLKYWAGATEDHTGVYFEGLEGYPTTDYVRTFSRPELEKLFHGAGFGSCDFYYPYPDYKLPERIYSDRCLPHKGELNKNIQNFDRQRMLLFSEEKVYDTLIDSEVYPLFSNSYLAVLKEDGEEEGLCGEKLSSFRFDDHDTENGNVYIGKTQKKNADGDVYTLCYSKYSNERAPRFRIRTDILEQPSGKKVVRKKAMGKQAQAHIDSTYEKYRKLQENFAGSRLQVNRCEYRDGAIYLEWLQGETLESELDALLQAGQMEKMTEKIREYFGIFSEGQTAFRETSEFVQVFGHQPYLQTAKTEKMDCREISDIDMVFANAVRTSEGYQKIDCEWTFEFPIPVKYLQYRCIYYYVLGNPKREELLLGQDLYEIFGISPEAKKCFEDMEAHFQQYILGDYQPIWRLYDAISQGVVPVQQLIKKAGVKKSGETVEVFFDNGAGFCAENSRQYQISGDREQLAVPLPPGTRALRIDPCEHRCIVRVQKLEQAGSPLDYTSNGHRMPNGDLLFDTEDPQILISSLKSERDAVQAVLFLEPLEGIAREALLAQDGRIRWMEQTKVWKLYRKLRRLVNVQK